MSSAAIIEAFNRQISVDPARTSLYLQSLRSIGHLRGGDDGSAIDQAVQVAYAEGKYTDDDIASAYEYFGFQHDDAWLTEDTIIGKFYAFLGATTSSQETEVRQQLWRIGDSRRSERIKSAAEDRMSLSTFRPVGPDTIFVFQNADRRYRGGHCGTSSGIPRGQQRYA